MTLCRMLLVVCCVLGAVVATDPAGAQVDFKRGDANGDGCLGLLDSNRIFEFLFLIGAPPLDCEDAADANDDGVLNVADPLLIVAFLTLPGAVPPAPPGPDSCGPDPTLDLLDCDTYDACGPCDPDVCTGTGAGGTVSLPPPCGYVTPDEVHMIIDGLPPGTEIEIGIIHAGFTAVGTLPGGVLGGEIETFDSVITLEMQGTGVLAGFSRTIEVMAPVEIHTAPQTPGVPRQTFETEMIALEGQVIGDPDFDLLHITAGTDMGFPSPGETTIADVTASGSPLEFFDVQSSFNVGYQIEFMGAPGGQLDGMSGVTEGNVFVGTPGTEPPGVMFVAGNLNGDSDVDIGDVITILGELFPVPPLVGPPLTLTTCPAAFDVNADDLVDIADPIYLLSFLFSSGPPPPSWGGSTPSCGPAGAILECLFPPATCP